MPFNTKNIVRDLSTNPVPQYFNQVADQFEVATGSGGAIYVVPKVGYNSANDMYKIQSMQKKWKSSFVGSSLDATQWDIIQQDASQTLTVSGGVLSIGAGTSANAQTIIQSTEVFTDPVRVLFGLYLSQRIVNQEFFVEFVSVDPITLQADGLNGASWRISQDDTAVATSAIYEVWNGGQARLVSAVSGVGNTTIALNTLEIELSADEVWFHSRGMDSPSGRTVSFVRHQQLPDPNALYKVRIRARNKAVAPASNTNFIFQFVTVVDYAELTAEITAGRGNVAAGQGLAVTVAGGSLGSVTATRIDANATPFTDTTTNLASSATFTGTVRDSGASYDAFNRIRATIAHTAGVVLGHLVLEQSTDNVTFRETHRIPIPSDGQYRTFDFAFNNRYARIKFINGVTAQSLFFLSTVLVRIDGGTDFDKTLTFNHSITPLVSGGAFTGNTLNIGGNHSFNRHRATVFADQAGTLALQQSRDGTSWRTTVSTSISGNVPVVVEDLIVHQYLRTLYTNGVTTQTGFELFSALVRQ